MTLEAGMDELTRVMHPLAVVLGVGLDGRLGDLLMPPMWRQAQAPNGTWVFAGGRTARAPNGRNGERSSWALAAATVLAAEMCTAGEDGAYALSVIRRAQYLQDMGVTHRHPYIFTADAPAEIERSLQAVSAVLLTCGWVLDLGREA